jgi:hypothetical protein
MPDAPNDLLSLISHVRAAPISFVPTPWRPGITHAVGGLDAVGFAHRSDLLLVTSSQGRGVFDCVAGNCLERDHAVAADENDWQDDFELEALGIGPLAGRTIRIAGLPGGALARTTRDGWCVERFALDWPIESVLLTPPGSWIYETRPGRSSAFVKLAEEYELRACGFSPTGNSLVVATASELTIFARTPTRVASR